MHERHVEEVDPVPRTIPFIAVAVPAVSGREQDVARLHVDADAVDDRVAVLRHIHDEAQRIRRMAMGAGRLAGQDHLVGGDEGTQA